ncbi:MAG: carboxypeptidase regulatory-like domain-containing protein [Anaerolineales bacterium]|nr:carboxypeptidase regulatory-like domain-containing protein [Anaerolineales bacterium]
MNKFRWFLLLGMLTLLAGYISLRLVEASRAAPAATISGMIEDEHGMPVSGATVRIQATANSTLSASDGTFTLGGLNEGQAVTVSAWKDLYYCAKVEEVIPPTSDLILELGLYQTNDNPEYEWLPPTGHESCYSCKVGVTQIWLDNDLHGRSGNNARFFSLYNGTDITGTVSLAPGYKLDFPGTAGNCATCHAPGAALDAPFSTDMNLLSSLDQNFGIHCDFCHKVADVYLNPATDLPYNNAPGVISMDVRRPFPGERFQLFFGTFDDDNVPEEDTYLPLIERSQWCAPCHQFSFWGTPIYQSYKEWLDSSYPEAGIECQTCHMPSDGVLTNVAPGFGGVERDPLTIHAHTMPGAASEALLQETVAMTMTTGVIGDSLVVTVTLKNTGAGHHVPTDHPGRHMILAVAAVDQMGQPLVQVEGSIIPFWGGEQAGWPGIAYAKVLRDALSGDFPVVSYWKQAFIQSDNRLPALASDTTVYKFLLPVTGGELTISANLFFRRNFQADMDARGWEEADILMEQAAALINSPPIWVSYFALVHR